MTDSLTSIVITKHEKGYIASLRFTDSRYDIDLSSSVHYLIYEHIEKYIIYKYKQRVTQLL
jgi:hypothetical protein